MRRFLMLGPLAALALAAAPLAAQGRDGDGEVPPGQRPPPGMCRIWLDNVPAGQQPAPTDCATAVRNRPPNGRVIFGDEPRGSNRGGAKPKRLRPAPSAWRTRDRADARPARGEGYADARGPDAREWMDDEEEYPDEDWRDGEPDRRTDRDDRESRDRYGRFLRPGSDVCEDRNRDGRCDDAQGTGDLCVDRDRDGLCDEDYGSAGYAEYGAGYYGPGAYGPGAYGPGAYGPGGYGPGAYPAPGAGAGRSLPRMRDGAAARRGALSPDVSRWLGAQEVTARVLDANRDGTPERVTWLTTRGEVVQVWYDRTGDGVADRVEFFEAGRRVRVIGQ